MDSNGSAMAENAKWLDSIEGKTYQLTNALETMWSHLIDSDMAKGFLEFLTEAVKFLDTLPGRVSAVAAIGAALMKWKNINPKTLGIDAYKSLEGLGAAQTKINKLKGTNPTGNIQQYADAVAGLTAKQQANMLASAGLNKTQIKLAMTTNGLKQDVVDEATAHIWAKNSKVDDQQATRELTESKIRQAAATLQAKGTTDELAIAELFEARASDMATKEDAEQIIMTSDLTQKQKELAMQYYNTATAQNGLKNSWAGLKSASPLSTFSMIAMIIPMLVSWTKELIDTTDELKESYDELQSSISSIQDEINTLDEELETVQEKIDGFSNRNLTFTEAQELQKLKEQSAELEVQKALQEKILAAREEQNQVKSLSMINNLLSTTAANQERNAESWKKWGQVLGGIAGIIIGIAAAAHSAGSSLSLTAAGMAAVSGAMAGSSLGGVVGEWGGNVTKQVGADLIEWYESYEKAITEAEQKASEAQSKYMSNMTDKNYEKWQKKVEATNTLQTEMYDGLTELQGYISNLEYDDTTKDIIDGYNNLMSHIDVKNMGGDVNAQIDSIQSLTDEYARLSRGVDEHGNNIALTAEEYARYQAIVSQVLGYNVGLTQAFTENGASIYDAKGELVEYNEVLITTIELLKQQQRQAAINATSGENGDNKPLLDAYKAAKTNAQNATPKADGYYIGGTAIRGNEIEEIIGAKYAWYQDFEKYIYENAGLIDKNLEKILSKAKENGMSDDELKAYEKYLNAAIDYANNNILESQFKQTLSIIPKASDYYYGTNGKDAMGGNSIAFINDYIDNYVDSIENLDKLKEHDITMIQKNIESFVDDLGANKDAQEIINDMFELDADSLSVGAYEKELKEIYNKLLSAAPELKNELETIGIHNQDQWVEMIVPTDETVDKMQTAVEEKLQDGLSGVTDTLTLSELKIAFQYRAELEEGASAADLRALIEKYKEDLPGVIVQTYSTLSEQVAQFNEVAAQTSEVLLDNTKVTQEYKDSLIALGISEEDLAECFDATNGLVVKNADALNDLVKDSKKSYAQNIKLAKSQARLDYYEKYKELKQLTNGQKVSSAATLSQVKLLYEEMNALQKTISKYSMLEHQLLGATNAYEEFAKAQEIDEANDYESKAEELVGHLVDAFHTAKLGSESAQAAIKGLVPKSVYEDLDTLDKKMDAVYKYFTEDLSDYFYVKFNDDGSLESAEMLIDNVKKFVEDGIGNGVFTGSWEEWDLDPTINSLDELAKKMGVTKEVAYAFLQSMETYDISWIGGDASTLLDKLIPSTAEIKSFGEQMQQAFDQTSIDLTARVRVDSKTMQEKHWDVQDGDYATLLSQTYLASDFGLADKGSENDYAINVTPILPDGTVIDNGEDGEGLWNYIMGKVSNGEKIEDLDIFLGSYKTLEEAKTKADELHKMQEDYYNMVKSYNLENAIYTNTQKQAELQYKLGTGEITADSVVSADGKTTAAEQLEQLNKDAEENAKSARENATAWTEANKAYEDAKEAVDDLNDKLESAENAKNEEAVERITDELKTAEKTLWGTYAALVKCGEPTEVTLTVAKEQVQADLAKLEKTMSETEINIASKVDVTNLEKDKDGKWIVDIEGYSTLDEASKAKVQEYIGYLSEEHNINILQGEGAITTLDVLKEIKTILSDTYTLMVETNDAQTKAQSFSDVWNSIRDKTVTLTQNIKDGIVSFFTRTPKESDVNGTAHAYGTAFAGGSWGAPRTETALTGELGPEILVRNGKWTTVGENGAEFTDIKKGDIIFNH